MRDQFAAGEPPRLRVRKLRATSKRNLTKMENGGGVSLTLDCEDMFKEITKKLYGEEATVGGGVGVGVIGVEFPAAERDLDDDLRPEEHITAWGLAALMQNGFPPPGILQANFTPRIDTTAEDRWTSADEPLAWAHSRVASYNPAQRLFKCCECECVGFLARIAEHWLGTHSQARAFQCPLAGCGFASGWARGVRTHLARDHHSDPAAADHLLRDNPALADLTRYLQRLKTKVEQSKNERRAGNVESPAPAEAEAAAGAGGEAGKRYICQACPYATDRRDLFTRHENIHRDEKPFHCYLCQKQFNRADHVKKHFLRMHRDQPKPAGEPPPAPTQQPTLEYRIPPVKIERTILTKAEPAPVHKPPPPAPAPQPAPAPLTAPAPQPVVAAVRRKSVSQGERRYACCYCSWSGVDNWCLKRHLNTHLKPFACSLCEYKAARAERLATHVHKVHNKKACAKCPYLADDQQQLAQHLREAQRPSLCEYKAARAERLTTHVHKVHNKKACAKCPYLADDQQQLAQHLREAHHIENRNLKVPTTGVTRVVTAPAQAPTTYVTQAAPQTDTVVATSGNVGNTSNGGNPSRRRESRAAGAARLFGYLEASDGSGDEYEVPVEFEPAPTQNQTQHFTRDKENAAPTLHHTMHHDHCLRY
ncbi:hypothetical protein NE865_04673 [Phthorimaea operculella]|nr:hypothetical protein NE865_04673 [Phthorimaea operculella]